MKLLFITTQFPYPLDNGGKIGAFNGLSVVSDICDTTCLSFCEDLDVINEGLNYYKKILSRVKFEPPVIHDIHIRKKPWKLLKAMTKSFFCNLPYVTAKFEDTMMYRKIDSMFKNVFWDVIFIDYLNMNIYADYIRKKYKGFYGCIILKDHNVEYEIVRQAANASLPPKRWILDGEWKRTFQYEKNAIKKAHIVFSVCDSNSGFVKQYNKNSYTMLPTYNVIEVTNVKKSKNRILYMGNLSWEANIDGLKWFVKRVFPLIRKSVPDTKLTIVGSGLSKNPFTGEENIDYIGYLKDISNIYLEHNVFIVPLFKGSGIRIKILEAFNNELAVVSTTLGCNTINAMSGRDILIADTEEEFSDSVVRLLTDDKLNSEMTRHAKKFLEERFSLDTRKKEFEIIIRTYMSHHIRQKHI